MSRDISSAPLDRLGDAVLVQRARLRISQEQAGLRAGMHRNYVGAIERGEINPTYETLLRLARGLDVPLHTLIQEATGRRGPRPRRRRRRSAGSSPSA